MDLFDKFRGLRAAHARIVEQGSDPFGVTIDAVLSPTEAIVHGRRCILVGTNNYLGLTFDEDGIEAAQEALRAGGTGTTGSRVANGTYRLHLELENEIAEFFGRRAAMVFTTGYQANLGLLSTIAGRNDYILIDGDCHASIYDGCALGAATVIRFRHNDPKDLERRLRRLGSADSNKLIVVEGIYSMIGDRAPLAEIAEIKQAYNAYLMVDEAHSLGVLGARGRGLAEEAGVESAVDFIVGTFSKSLATIGGFCASDHPGFDGLRLASRSYLFTASLPPSTVASARAALNAMATRPALRQALWRNTDIFYDGLSALGFSLGGERSPVIAVRLPTAEQVLAAWNFLIKAGVYVNLAMPPATPSNTYLLRCSVCAAHTEEQLHYVLDVFASMRKLLAEGEAGLQKAEVS